MKILVVKILIKSDVNKMLYSRYSDIMTNIWNHLIYLLYEKVNIFVSLQDWVKKALNNCLSVQTEQFDKQENEFRWQLPLLALNHN